MENSIKTKKELLYKIIKDTNKLLEELRSNCKHTNTEECNYSFDAGKISRAIICSDCGELLETEFSLQDEIIKKL